MRKASIQETWNEKKAGSDYWMDLPSNSLPNV